MAPIPTVQNSTDKRNVRPLGGSQASGIERRSELVTRVKYCNTLPDLPFDTKFIAYPFESNRFVTYSTTSLERNYTYEVLTEPDLGVDVELVIPNAYSIPANQPPPPLGNTDEKLLEDDALPSHQMKNEKRSRHHAKSVSWLRRTEYISTEQTRFQPQTIDKVEAKVGYSVKKMLKDDFGHYMDRESQIKSIEKTFEDSLIPIDSHFAKPGVTPVEILPVFPDFKLWKYPCAQVIFDSDPAPAERPVPAQLEEMSQAMIRGVMDESGEQFVAYFLPTDETLQKRKRDVDLNQEYEDDEVYEYRMAREYNWNVKSKATKGYEENYFFAIREDGVYYNELETRVRLNKRRVRGANQQLNTKLCVKHIPLAASDYKFQRGREKELEPLAEEEEEENKSEEESEKGAKSADEKSDDERDHRKDATSGSDKDKSDSEDEKDASSGSDKDKSDSEDEKGKGKPLKGKKSGSDKGKSDSEDEKDATSGSDKDKSDSGDEKDASSASDKDKSDSEDEKEKGKPLKGKKSGSDKGKSDSEDEKDATSGSDKDKSDSEEEKGKGKSDSEDAKSGSEKGKSDSEDEKDATSGSDKDKSDSEEEKSKPNRSRSRSGSSSGSDSSSDDDSKSGASGSDKD